MPPYDTVVVPHIRTMSVEEQFPYAIDHYLRLSVEHEYEPECYAAVHIRWFLFVTGKHYDRTLCAMVVMLSKYFDRHEDYKPTLSLSEGTSLHTLLFHSYTVEHTTIYVSYETRSTQSEFLECNETFIYLSKLSGYPHRTG